MFNLKGAEQNHRPGSGVHSRPKPIKLTPKFCALAAEPSCAGSMVRCSMTWVEGGTCKGSSMLPFLLVLTTVVAGVVLARIGVEKAPLPKPPSGAHGS